MSRYLAPLALFVAIVVLLGVGLTRDPRLVPSPLIGKPAPEFSLARVRAPERTLGKTDLLGQVSLLNAWATWCVACRQEHGTLLEIAGTGEVPIYGLNYKDQRADAIRWLDQLGDPYVASAYDPQGRLGLDLGIYGIPETFIFDAEGVVAYKHIGPLTPEVWRDTLLPIIRELKRGRG